MNRQSENSLDLLSRFEFEFIVGGGVEHAPKPCKIFCKTNVRHEKAWPLQESVLGPPLTQCYFMAGF